MKTIFGLTALTLSAAIMSGCSQAEGDQSAVKGPYLGQKPPGLTPEVFAPGIVSMKGRHEGAVAFSPDLDEIYFNAQNQNRESQIFFSRFEGGQWAPMNKAGFITGQEYSEIHPFVSPDGQRIYFTAVSSDPAYNKIWYVDRMENGWSHASILKSPVNDDQVFYPNLSADGDLYYFNLSKFQTYRASDDTNGFSRIEPAGIDFGVHAFIAPSQDYLVLNAQNKEDESRNDNDIYVSFKREGGSWARPVNLGSEVNSTSDDRAPTISPDGKYLFFGRDEQEGAREADIYWVSTAVIERLRPKP